MKLPVAFETGRRDGSVKGIGPHPHPAGTRKRCSHGLDCEPVPGLLEVRIGSTEAETRGAFEALHPDRFGMFARMPERSPDA